MNALLLAAASPVVAHTFKFSVWIFEFTGFGLAVVMAFVVAQMISQERMAQLGFDPTPVGDMVIGAIVGGLLGAKLYYVFILGNTDALLTRGGFVFWGGLVGGATGVLAVSRMKKVPLLRTFEIGTPALAAAYSVGRTGCWTVGDDYGRPWSGPLAVQFPDGAPASTAGNMATEFGVKFPAGTDPNTLIAVHPTQLYEVTMAFVMFLIIWRLRKHQHREGWIFGVYLILAGIERFVVEFFRAKDDRLAIGLTIAQVIAITAFTGGIVWLTVMRKGRTAPATA